MIGRMFLFVFFCSSLTAFGVDTSTTAAPATSTKHSCKENKIADKVNIKKLNYLNELIKECLKISDRISLYNLGDIYSVLGKQKQSFRFYKKAANKGNKDAYLSLCMRYFVGKGVPKSVEKAETWCDRAVMNNVEDVYPIYFRFLAGTKEEIGNKNKKVRKLLMLGVDRENLFSLYASSVFHFSGRFGFEFSVRKAVSLAELAAQKGHTNAIEFLVQTYSGAFGPEQKDFHKFQYWKRKARKSK